MGNINSNEYSDDEFIEILNTIVGTIISNSSLDSIIELYNSNTNESCSVIQDNIRNLIKELPNNQINTAYKHIKDIKEENTTLPEPSEQCEEIMLYYMRIIVLFSSIVSVVRPIERNENICNSYNINECKIVNPFPLCLSRIKRFLHKIRENKVEFGLRCSSRLSSGNQTLANELGMDELKMLYMDSYNKETRKFEMSETSSQQYNSDMKKFYTALNSSEDVSDPMDIPITDYCVHINETKLIDHYKKKFIMDMTNANKEYMNIKNELEKYASGIKTMKSNYDSNVKKLQEQMMNIFEKVTDNDDNEGKSTYFIIRSDLTETKLIEIMKESRVLISKTYQTCEEDSSQVLELFKNILRKKLNMNQKESDGVIETVKNMLS